MPGEEEWQRKCILDRRTYAKAQRHKKACAPHLKSNPNVGSEISIRERVLRKQCKKKKFLRIEDMDLHIENKRSRAKVHGGEI